MKKLGIGYEDYKEFVDNNMYYVDKTFLISDIIKRGGKVNLFTRPRRFGKTLALSMIQTFFEEERDLDGNVISKERYFSGKEIMKENTDVLSKMGKYPVIRLSLKSARQSDFDDSFMKIRDEIVGEFIRHDYVLDKDGITGELKARFKLLRDGVSLFEEKAKKFRTKEDRELAIKEETGKYSTALKTLSEILSSYHKKKVILLLDEYDVPLENAYSGGFYNRMVEFIRSLFESVLKTNDALEMAIITGCLRISKESIFTGLNNIKVNSITGVSFAEGFGFTEREVKEILREYGLDEKYEEVRLWYDGYLFGNSEIYNPWSVVSYVDEKISDINSFPKPYWSNTSSNSIIKMLVDNADNSIKEELDNLILGGTIEKKIHEDITYEDISVNEDNIWNFLYFTGYMKKVSVSLRDDDIYATMMIPNKEIRAIYKNQIQEWFEQKVRKTDLSKLYESIISKNVSDIQNYIDDILSVSISYFDSAESFYHGFLLSLLYEMPNYTVKSNREEGNGRPDIILYPYRPESPVYIFEIKVRKKFVEMAAGLKEARDQIKRQKYEESVLSEGYCSVISYGICFCKKSCIVECGE